METAFWFAYLSCGGLDALNHPRPTRWSKAATRRKGRCLGNQPIVDNRDSCSEAHHHRMRLVLEKAKIQPCPATFPPLSHGSARVPKRYPTVSHLIPRYPTMSHHVPPCPTASHQNVPLPSCPSVTGQRDSDLFPVGSTLAPMSRPRSPIRIRRPRSALRSDRQRRTLPA